MLTETQQFVFADNFAAADSTVRIYLARWPDDPAGLVFRAAVLLAEMTDREENLHSQLFPQLLDSAELLASQYHDTARSTQAWMQLWIGHARAYRSVWESRFGSFTTALRKGLGAKGEYEKGLRLDSTVYDLYAGLGAYHYWKSAKAGVLRWIGIFSNDKKRGIDELWMAAESSLVSTEPARSALIWVYLDAEKYDSALAIARQMQDRYPAGRSFLWPAAQAHFRMKQYDSAIVYFTRLRGQIATMPGNRYNLIECDFYLARCYELMERSAQMQQAASPIADYGRSIPEETRRRQSGKISYLMEKAGQRRIR